MKLLLLLVIIIIIGCMSPFDKNIKSIYENREEIISTFKNVSVFRKGTENKVFLYTYKDDLKNEYVFTMNQKKYSLFRDTLLFSPDLILGVNEQDMALYRKQLTDKLEFYLREMDSLKISDIDSEFFMQGIDLKIYMKSNAVVVYVADPQSITNPEWANYLKSMKKFDENWYYAMKDK